MSKPIENQDNGLFTLDMDHIKHNPQEIAKSAPLSTQYPDIYIDVHKNIIDDKNDSNIDLLDNQENGENLNSKELQGFSDMEQRFITNMLSCQFSNQNSAMRAAGFTDASEQVIYGRGCRILEKLILNVGSTAKIFRMMGVNEVRVCRGLIDLAEKARSEGARTTAWQIIGKILSMIKDNTEVNQGHTIINVFNQEITKRYEVTQVNLGGLETPSNDTANIQKRYELPSLDQDEPAIDLQPTEIPSDDE